MGVELHITRAEEFYFDNENTQITSEEWLSYVETDPELELCQNQGSYFTKWLGESAHEDPWLDWFDGNIHSKWPDTALYHKMLKIAKALNAKIQDDDVKVILLRLIGIITQLNAIKKFTNKLQSLLGGNVYLASNHLPTHHSTGTS